MDGVSARRDQTRTLWRVDPALERLVVLLLSPFRSTAFGTPWPWWPSGCATPTPPLSARCGDHFANATVAEFRLPAESALETPCSYEQTVRLFAAKPDTCVTDR